MAVIKIVPMPGAVGDKGDEGAPGSVGPQGERGLQGTPGTNAVWSYQGAWNSASAYAVGDVVVYQGQLYYTKSVTTAGTLPTVTAKFDLIASKGADGTNGTNGTNGINGADGAPGTNGADALWNYTGAYSGGSAYAVGDLATYDGQLWYRYNSNGGNVGDTPSPGLWNLIAAKGADGGLTYWDGTGNPGTPTNPGIAIINGIATPLGGSMLVSASDKVWLSANNGEFLNDPTVPANQIATIGDLPTGATGAFETSDSKLVTVTNGIITAIDSLT